MEIRFQGSYDRALFAQALQLVNRRSPTKAVMYWGSLAMAVGGLAAAGYIWSNAGTDRLQSIQAAALVLLAGLLLYFYASPYLARRAVVSRSFKDSPSRTIRGQADQKSLTIVAGNGNRAEFEWARFLRKGTAQELIALMALDGSLVVFHRSFFDSDGDWSRFRKLIDQKVAAPR